MRGKLAKGLRRLARQKTAGAPVEATRNLNRKLKEHYMQRGRYIIAAGAK